MPSEPVLSLSGGGDGGQLQRTCQGCHMGRPNLVLFMLLSGCQEPCTDVAASIFQGFSSTPGHRGALKHRHSATAVRRLQKKGGKKKNMQCSVDAALCTADTRSRSHTQTGTGWLNTFPEICHIKPLCATSTATCHSTHPQSPTHTV